jgi:hypothetical protein
VCVCVFVCVCVWVWVWGTELHWMGTCFRFGLESRYVVSSFGIMSERRRVEIKTAWTKGVAGEKKAASWFAWLGDIHSPGQIPFLYFFNTTSGRCHNQLITDVTTHIKPQKTSVAANSTWLLFSLAPLTLQLFPVFWFYDTSTKQT